MIKGLPDTPAEIVTTIIAQEAECQRLRQVYKLIKLDIEAGSVAEHGCRRCGSALGYIMTSPLAGFGYSSPPGRC